MKEFEHLLKGKQLKRLYQKEYGVILEKYQLRQVDLDLLYLLSLAGEHDTAHDMAEMGNMSKAHVSKSIDRLRHNDMVLVQADAKDRRCGHVLLTTQGVRCLGDIEKIRQHIMSVLYEGVTESEKKVLSNVAHKMADNIRNEMNAKSKK